jgi:hypothetical protein
MTQPAPIHTHDCNLCRYLGTIASGGGWHDVYVCERNPVETDRSVIMRYGSDGPEYTSVPLSMTPRYPADHPLRLAAAIYAGR